MTTTTIKVMTTFTLATRNKCGLLLYYIRVIYMYIVKKRSSFGWFRRKENPRSSPGVFVL